MGKRQRSKETKSIKRFDPIIKNILSETAKSILSLAGIKVSKIKPLPIEIHITKTFRLDSLFDSPNSLYHIEIQNYRDPSLPERMFEYYFAIRFSKKRMIKEGRKLKPIQQIVIWSGRGKPPPSEFKEHSTIHRYIVIDARKISPERFLVSDNPYEVILALVVGEQSVRQQLLPKVIKKLEKIAKSKREFIKYMEEVNIVARLFNLKVGKEMSWLDIVEETFFFRKGLQKGRKEGKKEGRKEGLKEALLLDIRVKFGRDKVQIIKPTIEKIDDIRKLKAMKIKVVKASSWQEFLKFFKSDKSLLPNSKNKNSKNKR